MPGFNPTPNSFFHWLFTAHGDAVTETRLRTIRECIAKMFDLILKGHAVPEQWKRAEVVCLLKSGDPKDPANYRPIALLASIYKLYTAILTHRLSHFVEKNNILTPSQRGGRPGMCTQQLTASLMATISHAKNNSKDNPDLRILFH